mgnify:CR=1 FL=1
MPIIIDGTNGISGVDGTATNPAIEGTDTNTGIFYGADTVSISTGGTSRFNVDSSGNTNVSNTLNVSTNLNVTGQAGIGIALDGSQHLHIAAGTATVAPIELNSGTLMTTVDAGSLEYDGVVHYFTNDATSLRGYVPAIQIFRLTANGTAIGSAIANFFGANSAINLAGGGVYEIEAYCYFTKTTAGTVTVTATTSLAPVNLSGIILTGSTTGGTGVGAAQQIALYNSTATAAAFGATSSLTTGVNHAMTIRLIVEANASASNLRINFTESAGTVTPLRGSYYKVTRLPAGNTGSFAA